MKLQILIPSLHGAGAERFLSSLSLELAARGFTIQWLTLTDEAVYEFAGERLVCVFYPRDAEPDVLAAETKARRPIRWGSKFRMLANAARIARWVRRENRNFRPDVTLVVPVVGELHYVTTLLAVLRNLGLFHGRLVMYEGTIQSQSFKGRTWWEHLIRKVRFLPLSLIDRTIPISLAVRDDLIEHFGAPPGKLCTIPHGFDLARIRRLADEPVPLPWPDDGSPVILNVGRFVRQKRQDWLIDAFEQLSAMRDRSGAPAARLVIVGEGPLHESLREQIARSPVRDRIHLVPWSDNPYALMKKATLFALTSEHEPFGNVIVEAMAAGTPATAFDCPGAPGEILEPVDPRLLVPTGDTQGLAARLFEALGDADLSATWAAGCARRAEEFDLRAAADRYERLLRRDLCGQSAHADGPQRITITVPSLAYGGAERVSSVLANHWSRQGRDVHIVTLDSQQADTYALRREVCRIGLGVMIISRNVLEGVWNNIDRVRKLRRVVRRTNPDVVVSFTDRMNVLTLLACVGLKRPVIIAERSNPRKQYMGRGWTGLRRWTYRWCTKLVVQTERVAEYFREMLGNKPVAVIPNGVAVPRRVEHGVGPDAQTRTIIAMARLAGEKGIDFLIDAFARVADKHPGWRVRVLGEGPERRQLEELIARRQMQDRITLAGWVSDPTIELRQADLFVLSSYYEGFPNALLEAMACGVPAVSFDCDSGPSEIIRDGVDGVLVPPEDTAALAAALDRLMSNDAERERLASRAAEVVERFGMERFFRQWDAAIGGQIR